MSVETDCIMEVDTSAWPSSYYGRGKRVDLEKFFEKVQQEQKEIEQRQHEQDLARKQSQRIANGRTGLRQVRFSPDPPTVFEYEAEYDSFDRLISSIELSKDIWPSHARRPPHRLDLRPIRNHQYTTPSSTIPPPPPPPLSTTSSPSPLSTDATLLPQRSSSTSSATRPSRSSFISTTRSSSLPTTATLTASSISPMALPSTPPLSPSPPHHSHQDDSSDDDDQPSPIAPLTPTNSLPFSPTTLTKKLTAVFTRRKRS